VVSFLLAFPPISYMQSSSPYILKTKQNNEEKCSEIKQEKKSMTNIQYDRKANLLNENIKYYKRNHTNCVGDK
jgi:ATP-dependent Zn protease